jgi:hypothetical protein
MPYTMTSPSPPLSTHTHTHTRVHTHTHATKQGFELATPTNALTGGSEAEMRSGTQSYFSEASGFKSLHKTPKAP